MAIICFALLKDLSLFFVTAKTYTDGKKTTYAYEAKTSRLKSVTDAQGQKKTFTYAKDDRRTALIYSNTNTKGVRSFILQLLNQKP
jgi:YD repeat-containing protein